MALPSARPRDSLCNGSKELTVIIGTDPMLQLVHRPLPIRFGHGPLALHPLRFEAVQPGTLARQGAHDHTTAAFPLDATVVRLQPRPHSPADVPRGLVPHHPQRRFPCRRQPLRQPRQTWRRHGTAWTPIHTAEEQALWVRTAQPLTRAGLGLWGVAVQRVLEQGPRLGVCPGMEMGLSKTAPPDCILEPHDPVRGPQRQRDQAITPLFLRASCGSGLVLQCCARFPLVCSRWRARRSVSSLIRRSVTPCAEPTSAARASVQPPVAWP